jgi:hypothetical protein
MPLTRRDAATTVLLIGVVSAFYLYLNGTDLAFLDNTRGALLVIGALGLGMCIVGGSADSFRQGAYSVFQSALGVASLVIVVFGLVTAAAWTVTGLTLIVTVMWAAALIHRLSVGTQPGAAPV